MLKQKKKHQKKTRLKDDKNEPDWLIGLLLITDNASIATTALSIGLHLMVNKSSALESEWKQHFLRTLSHMNAIVLGKILSTQRIIMNSFPAVPSDRWLVRLLLGDDIKETVSMEIDMPQVALGEVQNAKGSNPDAVVTSPNKCLAADETVRIAAAQFILELATQAGAECIFTTLLPHLHDAFLARPFCPQVCLSFFPIDIPLATKKLST